MFLHIQALGLPDSKELFRQAYLHGAYLWSPFSVSGKRIVHGLMLLIFFNLNIPRKIFMWYLLIIRIRVQISLCSLLQIRHHRRHFILQIPHHRRDILLRQAETRFLSREISYPWLSLITTTSSRPPSTLFNKSHFFNNFFFHNIQLFLHTIPRLG